MAEVVIKVTDHGQLDKAKKDITRLDRAVQQYTVALERSNKAARSAQHEARRLSATEERLIQLGVRAIHRKQRVLEAYRQERQGEINDHLKNARAIHREADAEQRRLRIQQKAEHFRNKYAGGHFHQSAMAGPSSSAVGLSGTQSVLPVGGGRVPPAGGGAGGRSGGKASAGYQSFLMNSPLGDFAIAMSGIAATLFVFQQIGAWVGQVMRVTTDAEAAVGQIRRELNGSTGELRQAEALIRRVQSAGFMEPGEAATFLLERQREGYTAAQAGFALRADISRQQESLSGTLTEFFNDFKGNMRDVARVLAEKVAPAVRTVVGAADSLITGVAGIKDVPTLQNLITTSSAQLNAARRLLQDSGLPESTVNAIVDRLKEGSRAQEIVRLKAGAEGLTMDQYQALSQVPSVLDTGSFASYNALMDAYAQAVAKRNAFTVSDKEAGANRAAVEAEKLRRSRFKALSNTHKRAVEGYRFSPRGRAVEPTTGRERRLELALAKWRHQHRDYLDSELARTPEGRDWIEQQEYRIIGQFMPPTAAGKVSKAERMRFEWVREKGRRERGLSSGALPYDPERVAQERYRELLAQYGPMIYEATGTIPLKVANEKQRRFQETIGPLETLFGTDLANDVRARNAFDLAMQRNAGPLAAMQAYFNAVGVAPEGYMDRAMQPNEWTLKMVERYVGKDAAAQLRAKFNRGIAGSIRSPQVQYGQMLAGDKIVTGQYRSARRQDLYDQADDMAAVVGGSKAQAWLQRRLEELNVELQIAEGKWTGGMKKALDDYSESAGNAAENFRTAFCKAFGSIEDDLVEFVRTGKLEINELITSIGVDLSRALIRTHVTSRLASMTSAGVSGVAGWIGSLFAHGGVFGRRGLVPFANGGIVTGPTIFPFANGIGLMGEAGPEAIMPLTRAPGGDLGVRAIGGGLERITVNIHNEGGQQVATKKVEPRFNGSELVMDLWLEAYGKNYGSVQEIFPARR